MYALPTRITPELISDYVAGRLDAPDAATIECIMRKHESIASAVAGKPIEVVQGGADVRPGFGRPAMAFTTTHFEELTGRKPTSLRQLLEANKTALLTPPAPAR